MGYYYYASVSFPESAREIPEIDQHLKGSRWDKVEEYDGLICVSNDNTSCGDIDVVDLLKKHNIPYDHYHRDDNSMEVYTERFRLDQDGKLFDAGNANKGDEVIEELAKKTLALIEGGDLDGAKNLLREHIDTVQSIEDIAKSEDAKAARPKM